MTVEQQVLLLTRMLRLIEEMGTSADFIGKNDVEQYIRWASRHLADDMWQRVIAKDYGTNGNA
jgi:hypothetical protein